MTAKITTEARNATLGDLAELLTAQQAAKLDIIAPASTLRSVEGLLQVKGADAEITLDGVTTTDGMFRPTAVFDEGIADKLGVPLAYVRRMRAERPDMLDATVNGWLHGRKPLLRRGEIVRPGVAGDERSFLARCFKGADGGVGVARALLSNKFAIMDNLDVLTAALDGVRQSGAEIEVDSCDLTERRMVARISAPGVRAMAPELLKGYRNPFADSDVQRAQNGGWSLEAARAAAAREGLGHERGTEPIVFAGFVLTNSETGGGAFTITPRIIVQVCRNGLQMTVDAMRTVHLGGRLEDGIINWSADTERKNLALVTAKARDAVAGFLSQEYLEAKITALEEMSGKPLRKAGPTIELVAKKLAFSEEVTAGIVDHFVRGGQITAGGVLQAVTSYSQTVANADVAFDIEAKAIKAMELAYANA